MTAPMPKRRKRPRQRLMPVGHWVPSEFLSARFGYVDTEYGWVCGGLAITPLWKGSPKGRRPPAWTMTHCGSGHRVCIIEAHDGFAFKIADRVLALTDWTFDGLEGWKNTDPELMDKFATLAASLGKSVHCGGACGSHELACEIAIARAA